MLKKIFYLFNLASLFCYVKIAKAINIDTDPLNRLEWASQHAGYNVYNKTPFQAVIITIIHYVLGFVGMIFVVLILIAGYQWMTSGGNEEKIGKARDKLREAVIGLIIILIAWSITWFTANMLIKSTTPGYYSFFPWP
ncbi:pilin [Patescibacteria group bacterium]|nr:pilin [Patescibacteria group bacterium]